MVRRGFFSHASPEGNTWVERLALAGVVGLHDGRRERRADQPRRPEPRDPRGLEALARHRENLVSRPMNATGIGIARAADGRLFYTQLYLSVER